MIDPSIGGASSPTLVVIGAAARDLDDRDPRGWRLGGTVSYSALAAAHLGIHVRALIGVDELAATATELELLRAAGIEVELVPLTRGPVFDNRETPAGRVQHAIQGSDQMPIEALPHGWRNPAGVLLGPVAGELGDGWAGVFERTALVALAWQGLLREIAPGQPVGHLPLTRHPLVDRAHMLIVSEEDVAASGQPIVELLHEGHELVITHGRKGAIYLRRTDRRVTGRMVPAIPAEKVVDSTGAGDAFLAAWLTGRLLTPSPAADQAWRPLALAAVMASLSVGTRGLAEIPTRQEVCEALVRLRDQPLS